MKGIQVKRVGVLFVIILLVFLAPSELFAKAFLKEKLQKRLNTQSNIQFQAGREMHNQVDNSGYYREEEAMANEQIFLGDDQSDVAMREPRKSEVTAPILSSYAIYQTNYEAELEENVVTVNGRVVFEVFRKGWTQIPLVKSTVGLIDVSVNRGAAFVTMKGGKYYLMIDRPGRYTLNIEFLIKATRERENGPGNFAFEVQPAPISQFEFSMPETEVEIFVDPAIRVETKKEATQTVAWAVMPNTSTISVRWSKALPKEEITPIKLEPKIYADAATQVSVGEGVMLCRTLLNYSILQSEVSVFRVAMPEDVSLRDVQCKALRDWKVSKGDGLQYLDVYLNYGMKGSLTISLTYERSIGEGSVVAEVPWVKAVGAERENGYFGIAAKTNVELAVNKMDKVNLIDVKELPSSIWGSSTSPILLAFRYLKHPFSITIDVTRHEEVPVLIAAVDAAEYLSLVTDEGKVLTNATFHVRNNVKQFIRLDLPKDATLWSAFVAGKPVKPAKDKNGSILIPLEKSQLHGEGLALFPVEVVYLAKGSKMKFLGQLKLDLPKTDIPISEIFWNVYFPADYTYYGFGGDVKQVKGRYTPFSAVGGLVSRSRATQSLKMEMDEVYQVGQSSPRGASVNAFEQKSWEGQRKGALPIKISIPQQGIRLSFSKLLVTEKESPLLTVKYTTIVKKAGKILRIIIGIACLLIAAVLIRRMKKKK